MAVYHLKSVWCHRSLADRLQSSFIERLYWEVTTGVYLDFTVSHTSGNRYFRKKLLALWRIGLLVGMSYFDITVIGQAIELTLQKVYHLNDFYAAYVMLTQTGLNCAKRFSSLVTTPTHEPSFFFHLVLQLRNFSLNHPLKNPFTNRLKCSVPFITATIGSFFFRIRKKKCLFCRTFLFFSFFCFLFTTSVPIVWT